MVYIVFVENFVEYEGSQILCCIEAEVEIGLDVVMKGSPLGPATHVADPVCTELLHHGANEESSHLTL